ncbi:hypothetical protein niasHT_022692 [Heterodera trifolii]|uniref:Uncharacterized protein n=1 Tax=Heterodera trifolii TaxID=157864 RepID=A0ABD2JRK2_9BILA
MFFRPQGNKPIGTGALVLAQSDERPYSKCHHRQPKNMQSASEWFQHAAHADVPIQKRKRTLKDEKAAFKNNPAKLKQGEAHMRLKKVGRHRPPDSRLTKTVTRRKSEFGAIPKVRSGLSTRNGNAVEEAKKRKGGGSASITEKQQKSNCKQVMPLWLSQLTMVLILSGNLMGRYLLLHTSLNKTMANLRALLPSRAKFDYQAQMACAVEAVHVIRVISGHTGMGAGGGRGAEQRMVRQRRRRSHSSRHRQCKTWHFTQTLDILVNVRTRLDGQGMGHADEAHQEFSVCPRLLDSDTVRSMPYVVITNGAPVPYSSYHSLPRVTTYPASHSQSDHRITHLYLDSTIRLWDLATGRSMCTLTNHKVSASD